MVRVALAAAAIALGACQSKTGSDQNMPAAKTWNAPNAVASEPLGASGADPHMGGDPHAGLDLDGELGGDPHAGLDLDGELGGDPAMEQDPPDPNRVIDRSKFLRGVIDGTDLTRPKIRKGAILFLVVRQVDPQTGGATGAPIAVDRIDVDALPIEFELSGLHAMVAGTVFDGPVLIDARIDGDGEASSRQPGDIVGSVRATIPEQGLKLVLDTELD